MGSRLLLFAVVLGCNAQLHAVGQTDGGKQPDGANRSPDAAGPDARVAAWSTPATVNGASTDTLNIDDETLSSTMTEMYFGIVDTALTGNPKQLWMLSRATANDPWPNTPTKLGTEFNAPAGTTNAPTEESPRLSPDDLTLYWGRAGSIMMATRTAVGQPWGNITALASVNVTGQYQKWMATCTTGGRTYFLISRSNSPNGQDFYQGELGVTAGDIVTELNSPQSETSTFLSPDCLTTYFASDRAGAGLQLFTATRTAVGSTWTTPTSVNSFGTATDNEDPWMSADATTFYFATRRYGGTNTNKGVYTSSYR